MKIIMNTLGFVYLIIIAPIYIFCVLPIFFFEWLSEYIFDKRIQYQNGFEGDKFRVGRDHFWEDHWSPFVNWHKKFFFFTK